MDNGGPFFVCISDKPKRKGNLVIDSYSDVEWVKEWQDLDYFFAIDKLKASFDNTNGFTVSKRSTSTQIDKHLLHYF